ncbi:ECF RNA polymerase sigma factor SigK [Rathayibacter sp. YIM 133350]|uniref:ECF RNA polymerase sigma factor SigK n=1 Tax=Rathayibacter sp. YIM 133350 TaxID=3131992 RepID=UPI00307E8571
MRAEEEEGTPVMAPEELLARVGSGDQAAFGELYDQLAGRVLGLVRHLVRDHAQSEEVTQEIFLEIWQQAPRFDAGRGRAVTWVLTIAHRRAVDRIRSAQSARDRDVAAGHRELATSVADVAESVEIRLDHERAARALDKLTESQREAIQLAYYGGYTQQQIATLLDVPIGTIKTRIRDGMIRMREILGVSA